MQAHWERNLLNMAGDLPHPITRPRHATRLVDPALRAAYRACDRITADHSKSFYIASGLLSKEKRSAVRALYAFCRTVDDIVDEPTDGDRQEDLNRWRRIVQTEHAPEGDAVAAAWVDTLNHYHIPRHFAMQLIDGVARDLVQTRYQTFAELATYCYGVAATVGLMSMYIVGFSSSAALPYAIKLGVALQMTNILRDVGEDYRNGQVYLPQEELAFYRVTEAEIAAGTVTNAWRDFMRFQVERARSLYADAWKGIRLLERDGQLAIASAAEFYSGILTDIEAHDYNVFNRRASLSAWSKVSRLPALWWRLQQN